MSETFRERKARGLRKPSVTQQPSVISDDMEFAAVHKDEPIQRFVAPIGDENDGLTEGGSVTHERPGTVTMYKPSSNGYTPRAVPAGSIGVLLKTGWRAHCPHCGGDHGPDPNECPGKDPVAVRLCPVCGKRIYDNRVIDANTAILMAAGENDPNVIQDDAYAATTPAIRTKAALDLHIWTRHPQEAREMNLPSLPEPSKTVLDAATAALQNIAAPVVSTGVEAS